MAAYKRTKYCVNYDVSPAGNTCFSDYAISQAEHYEVTGEIPNVGKPKVRGSGPEGKTLCGPCQRHKYKCLSKTCTNLQYVGKSRFCGPCYNALRAKRC